MRGFSEVMGLFCTPMCWCIGESLQILKFIALCTHTHTQLISLHENLKYRINSNISH